jgi:hypothetical protein
MGNIRGQTRTKTERIKKETEAVGKVIKPQNVENIRGQTKRKTEMIKEETEAVETWNSHIMAKCRNH